MAVNENEMDTRDTKSKDGSLNLRLALLAGLVVYIVVTVLAGKYVPYLNLIEDEEWIGLHADKVLYQHGQPNRVADDGQGGSIITYEKVRVEDSVYDVDRMSFSVAPDGEIYAFYREP